MDQQAGTGTERRLRVVIADDSVVIRERMRAMLAEVAPVEVVGEARDAHETISALEEHRADVLILDLFMPGGGGIRVLERLRGMADRPVVIIHTNFPEPEYMKACRRLGAEHFLDKSDDPATLTSLLYTLAERG
jgi:DNA-binding NarL/FixJ family response regulator